MKPVMESWKEIFLPKSKRKRTFQKYYRELGRKKNDARIIRKHKDSFLCEKACWAYPAIKKIEK